MPNHVQQKTSRHASRSWSGPKLFSAVFVAACYASSASVAAAADGAALFEAKCAACHSVGGGPKFGPDLKDVVAKRGQEWTIRAIIDPARAGLGPNMPMLGVTEPEAEAISAYLQGGHTGNAAAPKAQPAMQAAASATPEEIQLGQKLFEGRARFANGGPACNACHNVNHDGVSGGGVLAADLTASFSRAGAQGLAAMLENAPFPVMQLAYEGKALSREEIHALIGFLQSADKDAAAQQPGNPGWKMFLGGVGGVIVLAGFFALIGGRRKKRCVNQDIYDRQLESE